MNNDQNLPYLQYNLLNWPVQSQSRLNFYVHQFIIDKVIYAQQRSKTKVFDIGFGIGMLFKMLCDHLDGEIELRMEGCEPSGKNYRYFTNNPPKLCRGAEIKTHNNSFLDTQTDQKFNYITGIYVFPHFLQKDLETAVRKIYGMLEQTGQFILVVANEDFLKEKLRSTKDLIIERIFFEYHGEKYEEILHYSDIPEIGRILDYNREENYYLHLFRNNGFELVEKNILEDNGFICTVFVFLKNE